MTHPKKTEWFVICLFLLFLRDMIDSIFHDIESDVLDVSESQIVGIFPEVLLLFGISTRVGLWT